MPPFVFGKRKLKTNQNPLITQASLLKVFRLVAISRNTGKTSCGDRLIYH